MIGNFQDLLTSVDLLNTLHGGISEPTISFHKDSEAHEIRARVPGIAKGALQVEVHNNALSVFYLIPIQVGDKLIQMPQVVHYQAIPYFIDISAIKAVFDIDKVVIRMPFNTLSSGYHKKLQIGEE